jgi:hypothetical protein
MRERLQCRCVDEFLLLFDVRLLVVNERQCEICLNRHRVRRDALSSRASL